MRKFGMSTQSIIIGASHAGAQIAISLRQEGWEGKILVISNESHLPYHRPPLSKGYVSGEKSLEDILLRPASYFEKRDIEFLFNINVTAIDRERRQIHCSDDSTRTYDKLALCTGARVRTLSLPGHELNGIHYLRSANDAEAIRSSATTANNVVIVGGGYVGLELAASLKKAGKQVTVLEMAPRLLARVAAAEVAEFYSRVHTEEGVNVVTNVSAAAFSGEDHVSSVVGTNDKQYDAELVVIGVGVIPNTDIAQQCGLAVSDGIDVNEFAQTSDPHIVAAGDCTFHPNKLIGTSLRLESVPNATEQAKSAAASMCAKQKTYTTLPWFWSDQYDLKLQIAGFNDRFDNVVIRGDRENSRSFAAFYLKENRVIAVDCINRAPEFATVKKALTKGLALRVNELANEAIKPKDLIIDNNE